jgi:large conductance mechanosensitive channel
MSRLSELEDELGKLPFVRGVEGFFGEFWKFAAKGNIFDLAIGVVIGTAFGAVVNSLVSDIITPFLSLATRNVNFNYWSYTIRPAIAENGTTTPAVVLNYGHLVQVAINFLVVGLAIFVFFRLLSRLRERVQRREAVSEQSASAPSVSTEERLLREIRNLLREQVQRGEKPNV